MKIKFDKITKNALISSFVIILLNVLYISYGTNTNFLNYLWAHIIFYSLSLTLLFFIVRGILVVIKNINDFLIKKLDNKFILPIKIFVFFLDVFLFVILLYFFTVLTLLIFVGWF